MYTTKEMQEKILQLKKEKDICILAHAYQSHDIWEVADYVGDSYGLSVQAAKSACSTVLMCGVRFMAETVKILSPEKKVLLSNSNADCPMANQMDVDMILQLKEENPSYAVAAYVNTTSELKTACDVCVTSSSAVKIIKNMKEKDILFIPDCNLGQWVAEQVPEKNIKLVHGGCPTHVRITEKEVENACKQHPDALLLVHPECLPEVSKKSGLCGKHYRNHGLCQKQFRKGIYHWHRKQYRTAPSVYVPGETFLPSVQRLCMPQYEINYIGRCLRMCQRSRRRRNHLIG